MGVAAAAAATTAAVKKLAADESICVEAFAAAGTCATADSFTAWNNAVGQATDPSLSLTHRIAAAQHFLTHSQNNREYLAAKAALSASIAATADLLAPNNGEDTAGLSADVAAKVDGFKLAIASFVVGNAQYALGVVTADTPSVIPLLKARGARASARAAAGLSTIASHASACAIHNAAAAAATASALASTPGLAAAIMAAAAEADESFLTSLHVADLNASGAAAAAEVAAANTLAAVVAAAAGR